MVTALVPQSICSQLTNSCRISSRSLLSITNISTIILGLLLFCCEVGALFFFSWQVSVLLSVFMVMIMTLSVVLICNMVYQSLMRGSLSIEVEEQAQKLQKLESEAAKVQALEEELLDAKAIIHRKCNRILFLKYQLQLAQQEISWGENNRTLLEEIQRRQFLLEEKKLSYDEIMQNLKNKIAQN
ncbi:hypothetical protein BOKEGFJH_00556 [Chlamydia avium]|uniref:IncA family protein n=1 Tax=Chlamydia avium TaxID=1457141 RepID=A0ABP2X5X3_9CHLA|nr:hypothetical protein [Chlamydia avium]EPP38190.1 hypothetical protein CP10881SC42_0983 [Chlamydia avium]VVT43027.1 hypothetical protein BOKEGFJH_00556 [Chlamydia avium]